MSLIDEARIKQFLAWAKFKGSNGEPGYEATLNGDANHHFIAILTLILSVLNTQGVMLCTCSIKWNYIINKGKNIFQLSQYFDPIVSSYWGT